MAANVRDTQTVIEALTSDGVADVRITQTVIEVLTEVPKMKTTQQFLNVISAQDGSDNELRTTQQFLNILTKNPQISGTKPIVMIIT